MPLDKQKEPSCFLTVAMKDTALLSFHCPNRIPFIGLSL